MSPGTMATECVASLQLLCAVVITQVTAVGAPFTYTVNVYEFGELPGVALERTCKPPIVPLIGIGSATLPCEEPDSPMPTKTESLFAK